MTDSTQSFDSNCLEIHERIPLYVGGDLELEVLEGMREHLAGCSVCDEMARRAVSGREALVGTLRQRESDYRRPMLWQGIQKELRAEGLIAHDTAELRPQPRGLRLAQATEGASSVGWKRVASWVPLAAAAALLFVLWTGSDKGSGTLAPGGVEPLADGGSGIENSLEVAPFQGLSDGSGLAEVMPVAHKPLRRIDSGETLLSEDVGIVRRARTLNRPRLIQAPSIAPLSGDSQLTDFH